MKHSKALIAAFALLSVSVAPAQTPVAVADRPAVAGTPLPAPLPLSEREMLEKRGDVQMARKNYREAAGLYQQAIALDPKSASLYNKCGISFHQQQQLGAAKKFYERAIKLNGKFSEATNNLGTVFYSQKKYKAAIRQYVKALALNPNSASVYSNMGTAHFARKKYEEAFAAYAKALALDPEVFEHRSTYGVLLQERSVADRALFHYFMAKTYAAAGMIDRAVDYLRKAFEEGYQERDKIPADPAFAEVIKTEAYAQLMANPPVALKP